MSKAVIISRYGMGLGDESLAILLLRRYLKADLDNSEAADRYAFYNAGVKAALLDEETNALLQKLEAQGSMVLLCGTCLDHFGLTEKLNVGKNACLGDVRACMAMERVDYL